jgi:hypothetical protein
MSNETDLAWLAGLLEGEGHFAKEARTQRGQPYINVYVVLRMTDLDIVDRAAAIMGRCSRGTQRRSNKNWKTIFYAKASGHAAARLMTRLLPLMGTRRSAKIREALDLWNSRLVKKAEAHQPSTCHPDRPSVSKGMCRPCYKKAYDAERYRRLASSI